MLAHDRLDETLEHSPSHRATPETAFPQWADAPPAVPDATPAPVAGDKFGAMLELRQLAEPEADPGDDAEAWHLPPPGIHTTGSQLRRRLVTPESIAELAGEQKPSLLQRLMRRK